LILQCLAVRKLGEQIIPAYKAITHTNSLSFIFFMFMVYVASFLAYYALPVFWQGDPKDNMSGSTRSVFWENVFETLVAMFRLDFSGDFDLGDMDGENQQINLKVNQTTGDMDGELNNAPTMNVQGTAWYHTVCAIYAGSTLIITIGLLNVYIGLLGELYNTMYKKRGELFEEFRATYTCKALLKRQVLKRCWKPLRISALALDYVGWVLRGKYGLQPEWTPPWNESGNEHEHEPGNAIWFSYDKTANLDGLADDAEAA